MSKFGIGVNVSKKSPVASLDYALKEILKKIAQNNKKVLITIDEARKTDAMIDFIQEFQILIREELPIYVIVAGLYEDIDSLENADGLTFFLRATKCEMTPLNRSELSPTDKWFMQFIVQKDQMQASDLLDITKKKHNEWSVPRKKLSEKGIIDVETRGQISVRLPRFKEFVEKQFSSI